MPAVVIARVEVTDPEKYENYKPLAKKAIEAFGGRYLVRGAEPNVLEGGEAGARYVVVEFDTVETAKTFYDFRTLPRSAQGTRRRGERADHCFAGSVTPSKRTRPMARMDYDCSGVIPACLLPLNDDLSIDEKSYRKHLRDVANVRGVAAITVNGHASEVSSCTFDEQEMLLEVALQEIGDRVPLINGVYADSAAEAVRISRMADEKGASALLVFPSNVMLLGSRPEMVLDHYRRVADSTDLPLIIFQFPSNTPLSYSHDLLAKLIEEIPSIKAMKDGCGDPVRHEMTVRELQSDERPFHVLTTHSAWLLPSLVTGCNGILSGAGSTIADLQVALFEAVQANDLAKARDVAARIYPTTHAFYSAPGVDMHNRMKEAQVLLGRLPSAAVRPPLQKLSDAEITRIGKAMKDAGIEAEGALRLAS